MKIVVISTFWNAEKFVSNCIKSLKNQNYTNFVAYFIDDMSDDNSFVNAQKAIGDDERFILIKNKEKKYKTKNFVDVINNNENIDWDDVIVELDGDDALIDPFVLGLINKIYADENVWICGSKWQDKNGNSMKYGKANADKPRTTQWNFSHMRTYRAFLFRSIQLEHLKYQGEFFKAACDLGHGIPMLEMAGNEHYYFLDKVTYLYNWHDHQSYSDNNSFGDKKLQGAIAKYIYTLPRYKKLDLIVHTPEYSTNTKNEQSQEVLNKIFDSKKSVNEKRESDIKNKEFVIKTNNSNLTSKAIKKIQFGNFNHPTRKK